MDRCKWRHKSRIVAYIDLGFSGLAILFTIKSALLEAGITNVTIEDNNKKFQDVSKTNSEKNGFVSWLLWIGIVLFAVNVCVDLWAAFALLTATKPGSQLKDAIKQTKIWRNITIPLLILSMFIYASMGSIRQLVVNLSFRGILLYVICKFSTELQRESESSNNSYALDGLDIT